jgi:transcription elongation factor Elf1
MKPLHTSFSCPRCSIVFQVHRNNLAKKKTPYCKSCATALRNTANAKHGLEKHPLYQTWVNMIQRIDRPGANKKNHGYAGLDMDPKWRDVTNFVGWGVLSGWEKGLSIERKDNKRGYWPDNCRWIPKQHQARNRRDNSMSLELAKEIQLRVARGETRYRVAKDVATETGIPLSTVVKVAYGYNWSP